MVVRIASELSAALGGKVQEHKALYYLCASASAIAKGLNACLTWQCSKCFLHHSPQEMGDVLPPPDAVVPGANHEPFHNDIVLLSSSCESNPNYRLHTVEEASSYVRWNFDDKLKVCLIRPSVSDSLLDRYDMLPTQSDEDPAAIWLKFSHHGMRAQA
jgi:hypothetical protein